MSVGHGQMVAGWHFLVPLVRNLASLSLSRLEWMKGKEIEREKISTFREASNCLLRKGTDSAQFI